MLFVVETCGLELRFTTQSLVHEETIKPCVSLLIGHRGSFLGRKLYSEIEHRVLIICVSSLEFNLMARNPLLRAAELLFCGKVNTKLSKENNKHRPAKLVPRAP